MINKKNIIYLIFGLGLGIIITNVLHSAYPKTEFVDLGENEIIERARDLGMVLLKESIELGEEAKEDKVDELEKTIKKLEEELNELEEIEVEEPEDENIPEEKEVVISSGSNLTEVAKQLYDMDLIDDEEEFIKFVIRENLSRKIITGKYKINNNSSYSEIIYTLTDRNHVIK